VNAAGDAEDVLREKNVTFLRFEVIYDLLNWVKQELEKLLVQEKIVTEVGRVKILAVFRTDKGGMTVGGRVEEGRARPGAKVRVKREGDIMGTGTLTTVQTGKQEVKEVPSGSECGMRYEGKVRIEAGDVLELYTEESKARKIVFQ
jgi:translation initiation factor IF-2